MIKEHNRKESKTYFRFALAGLICSELFTYIIFFAVNTRILENENYQLVGIMATSLNNAFPYMIFGILYFCIGYAFRGKERKSLEINLEEINDTEKWIYIAMIKKTIKLKNDDLKGIPDYFYPGGEK